MRRHSVVGVGIGAHGTHKFRVARAGLPRRNAAGFGRVPTFKVIEPQESRPYVAQEHYRRHDVSALLQPLGLGTVETFGITAVACIGIGLTSAVHDVGSRYGRELKNREAWEIIGGCFLPPLGRALLHRALFERHDLDRIYPPMDSSAYGGQPIYTIGGWRP